MKILKLASLLVLFVLGIRSALAEDVFMAFGDKLPPYIFSESNSGIEVEVIEKALAYKGHHLRPKYFPNGRLLVAFKNGVVDAVTKSFNEDLGAFYGNPAVLYNNVFITLKERKLKIARPEDLKGLSVFAFSGAINLYPEWLKAVQQEGNYHESHDQNLQIGVLFKKRYDVILSDRNVFHHFLLKQIEENNLQISAINEHGFMKVNVMDYRPVFRDENIRNDFNVGLRHLKKTGQYQAIINKYLLGPKNSNQTIFTCDEKHLHPRLSLTKI